MTRHRQADGRVHGVVAGLLREDGRWLCIRRGATVTAGLKIAFPGGGMEADETQEAAVVREMVEELGIEVVPVRQVWHWQSPSTELTLWGWYVTAAAGAECRTDPVEVAEILWLTGTEVVGHVDALPTCGAFVGALESYLRRE